MKFLLKYAQDLSEKNETYFAEIT